MARKLNLDPADADAHHAASPWRFNLVKRVMCLAKDPDTEVPKWLEHGTPVGIAVPIKSSGLLPLISDSASSSISRLQDRVQWTHNHPSFDQPQGVDQPAHDLLQRLVDDGHALLFSDESAAAEWLGVQPVPSPLGDVVKIKPDGSVKHRLIQDLKASAVNSASVVPERQVLPRFQDHARDLAMTSLQGKGVGVFVIDFQNAFMTLPLHPSEQPFNCSVAPHLVHRRRDRLHPTEPDVGSFLVWRVLGFGGHSNPLTYSRVACFAARSGQALLTALPEHGGIARGRLQLYVDDPVLTLEGSPDEQHAAIDVLCLWWLILGIPLSWEKGSFSPGCDPHEWIGVRFWSERPGSATMSIPSAFSASLLEVASEFVTPRPRTAPLSSAHNLCGKAGRLAQVVPTAKPFVTQLFAALAASLRAHHLGLREAPPRRVAKRRFRLAASWLVGLLKGVPFPLQHAISTKPFAIDKKHLRVEFDASPWGGAYILREHGSVVEWGVTSWSADSARHLGVVPALPKWQTFWELATLLPQFATEPLVAQ